MVISDRAAERRNMKQGQVFQEMEQLLAEYKELLEKMESLSRALPEGFLQLKNEKGDWYYSRIYQTMGQRKQTRIPISTADGARLMDQLCEKKAIRHGKPVLRKNIRILQHAVAELGEYDPEKYVVNAAEPTPLMLRQDRLFLPDQLNLKKWLAQTEARDYVTNPAYPENLRYLTADGRKVRSKSEVFWSDALEQAGLANRYECALRLKSGRVIYPDFTVLVPGEKRLAYIEHFGKMDDPQYALRAMQRLQTYADNGYLLGRDVFFTTETAACPLTRLQIEGVLNRIRESIWV